MSPSSTNQNNPQTSIDLRIRTMRTIWFCLLLTVGAYYVLTLFASRKEDVEPNPSLSIALICIGAGAVLVSFLIKSKLLSKAMEQQDVGMVQQAYVMAWAITEVPALLAILDFFLAYDRYYYALLIISLLGQLLHFPRREVVVNAAFKGLQV